MTTVITDSWIQERIDVILVQIEAYETAITELASSTTRSYTLSTGQTTQTVTKMDIARLQDELDKLLARLEYWESRLNRNGPTYARMA